MAKKAIQNVDLLETEDIFDIYGCEYLLNSSHVHVRHLESDEKDLVLFRVDEIHDKYVTSVRERIKSELRFCGVKDIDFDGGFSIQSMVNTANNLLEKEMEKQSEKMMHGGGFDMMSSMVAARQQAGGDMGNLDLKRLQGFSEPKPVLEVKDTTIEETVKEGFFNNPKWKVIADAFVALEEACTANAKIQSIDYLNDLQHNSFHLLIDLQTGRMLEDSSEGGGKGNHGEAVDILKEVLDIKQGAKSPKEFSSKMTSDIRKLIRKCAA
jgi:hypothetical protein